MENLNQISFLGLLLGVSVLASSLFRSIRFPSVLGALLTGILLKVLGVGSGASHGFHDWAEVGVILLMLSLGLEFSLRKFFQLGASTVWTALIEMVGIAAVGAWIGSHFFALPDLQAFLFGTLFSISSTTIIYRSLDELGLKTKRSSESIFGLLIVEDLAAVVLLVLTSELTSQAGATQSPEWMDLLILAGLTLFKLSVVLAAWFVLGTYIVPRIFRILGKFPTEELLTVGTVALAFGFVALSTMFHFSPALGAFIAGSILSESGEVHRIRERMEPLSQLFATFFFVGVGFLFDFAVFQAAWVSILALSLFVVASKSFFVTLGSYLTGQTYRGSVHIGLGMAQLGEFSFILASAAITAGLLDPKIATWVISVSTVTSLLTPILIRSAPKVALRTEAAFPAVVREMLTRYTAWIQAQKSKITLSRERSQGILRFILNLVLVVTVANAVEAQKWIKLSDVKQWLVFVVVSLPFIAGAWFSFSRAAKEFPYLNWFARLSTVVLLLSLSFKFLITREVVIFAVSVFAVGFLGFRKSLFEGYEKLEASWTKVLQDSRKTKKRTDFMKAFAPWDAHLVRLKVHSNSEWVSRELKDTKWRSRYALNIVAIQRGIDLIIAPKGEELIFPKDELLLLGTDEQIDQVRGEIEKPKVTGKKFQSLDDYGMRPVLVDDGSKLNGRSVKEAGRAEFEELLIVGIERGSKRILNPDPDTRFEMGDQIWVVGRIESLNALTST